VTIALVDYGAGNVPSVERALQRLGRATRRVSRPEGLEGMDAIILPGVGHYAAMIRALDEGGLRGSLLGAISQGVPFLGICLGLQVLYSSSEEAVSLPGLAFFEGPVRALPPSVKLPHMGWNRICIRRTSPLLVGLSESDYFYFAHSFASTAKSSEVVATCEHGTSFAAVVEHGRVFATQFHPEKSGTAGARVLENFLRLAAAGTTS
jgi:imidazole glycerol phosphate synthase glutamine amidotransferase subunit